MKEKLIRLIGAVVIAAAVLVALNYQFFWKRISFLVAPPHITTQPAPQSPEPPTSPTSTPDVLTIPRLGITAPVIFTTGTTEAVWQQELRRGVVHYPGTPDAGGLGNIYIFGHSSNYVWVKSDYNAVFALLPKINLEDTITLSGHDGVLYTYRVIEKKIVDPKDTSVLDQHKNERRLLTIQTSYPIGTALKRFIVVAELVP